MAKLDNSSITVKHPNSQTSPFQDTYNMILIVGSFLTSQFQAYNWIFFASIYNPFPWHCIWTLWLISWSKYFLNAPFCASTFSKCRILRINFRNTKQDPAPFKGNCRVDPVWLSPPDKQPAGSRGLDNLQVITYLAPHPPLYIMMQSLVT